MTVPVLLDPSKLTDKALQDFDQMMIEATTTVHKFAALAVHAWQDVLKEMDARGQVQIISGSYDDVGNALIQRHYRTDEAG